MRYVDFIFDLSESRIILDEEINTDKLGWKAGDIFRVVNVNGQVQLVKIDPIEKFARGLE